MKVHVRSAGRERHCSSFVLLEEARAPPAIEFSVKPATQVRNASCSPR